jgi:hypothetical protein
MGVYMQLYCQNSWKFYWGIRFQNWFMGNTRVAMEGDGVDYPQRNDEKVNMRPILVVKGKKFNSEAQFYLIRKV